MGVEEKCRTIAVLFSGGRDSSLAACLLAASGSEVLLLTGRSGTEAGGELTEIRTRELIEALGSKILAHEYLNTRASFREIAISQIEHDFRKYGKNLILLGATLALLTEAVVFCLNRGIHRIATGVVGYQGGYGEQRPCATDQFRRFLARYDIEYVTPVFDYASEDDVKYDLASFGVTTKSLEAVSIFSDSFSEAPDEVIVAYLEAKAAMAHGIINLRTTGQRED